jgi:hypothetical protein
VGCDAFWGQKWTPTYERAITKIACEYINVFMKIFLDDFIVFSDMFTHIKKMVNCFLQM